MITWLNACRFVRSMTTRADGCCGSSAGAPGSVVTWRRAQRVLLSAQRMPVAQTAEVAFTSPDRVRDVIHNFNADGFDSPYPRYRGGRPRTSTLPERREIRRPPSPSRPGTACRSRPGAWPSWPPSWSPRGWSTTSATRVCASCSAKTAPPCNLNTWKTSRHPGYATKKARVEHLYAIADGEAVPEVSLRMRARSRHWAARSQGDGRSLLGQRR